VRERERERKRRKGKRGENKKGKERERERVLIPINGKSKYECKYQFSQDGHKIFPLSSFVWTVS
jgi:hypothetical protein